MTIDEQIKHLRRGTTEIISEQDLRKKLEKGTPLRVKLGVDPTAKDVTLGWAVVLRKLRDFQKLGHTACLIIGDFTAMIGDPSGKSKTRKQLTREEVQANVDSVKTQLYKILDPEKTEIYYNKDWLGAMTFEDVIRLCSRTTVARIMERDDFTNRWNEHRPIALHELLYPLCQGMDSVEIKADIELGGNDQKFNNLVGRALQEHYSQEPQVVLLCPLLVGTDGKEKMSQSLGNYVSVVDPPNDMFGKTMSIPDNLIPNWFELCTDVPMDEVYEMLGIPQEKKMEGGDASCPAPDSPSPSNEDARALFEGEGVGGGANSPTPVIPNPNSREGGDATCPAPDSPSPSDEDARASSEGEGVGGEGRLPTSAAQAADPMRAPAVRAGDTPAPTKNPRDAKIRLAKEIVALYHSPDAAEEAERYFIETFSKKKAVVDAPEAQIPADLGDTFTLPHLIVALGLAESNGKARKLMEAGAVALDADKQTDPTAKHERSTLIGKTLRVGKHQFRKFQ